MGTNACSFDMIEVLSPQQRCQVSHFRRETIVSRRPLCPPVWQDLSPVFTFYLRRVRRRPPHARWWSRCLVARPPSAPLFTYLRSSCANSRCARHCTIVNMANWSDKSEKTLRNICKSTKMSTVNSIVIWLSRLRATSTPSALSVWRTCLFPVFSLILELCLLFKLCRLTSLPQSSLLSLRRLCPQT